MSPQDESNIRDRVEANKCDGFIGFYSTLPSSGLSGAIAGLSAKVGTQTYDRERIESELLKHPDGLQIANRYFPKSTAKWMRENPEPARIFATHPSLNCHHCGRELLAPNPSGIIVLWQRREADGKKHIDSIYWCCKGGAIGHSARRCAVKTS